jgi:D-beta-D-heptose 7-phosphate kinase/D-beta-D-heptose 1-phosphate adenosyltransferase
VQALKGPGRPVNPTDARALVLAGLQVVDYITVFEETWPIGSASRVSTGKGAWSS